jgi:hypothetical protein
MVEPRFNRDPGSERATMPEVYAPDERLSRAITPYLTSFPAS